MFRYVLSPTHLHEFKSADKTQAPVMSLYLPEQKLGSHSTEGGSSNKFVLKGRQTGTMHRGHTWVFRAESHDTMMAWYEDIKALTEKTPEELSNFVRDHSRSYSRSSQRSLSSDGNLDADEDEEPFTPDAAAAAIIASGGSSNPGGGASFSSFRPGGGGGDPNRPEPGGRFPSDLEVTAQRGLQVPLSPSSASSGILDYTSPRDRDHDRDQGQDHDYDEYAMRGGVGSSNSNPANRNANGANASPDYDAIAVAGGDPFTTVRTGNQAHLEPRGGGGGSVDSHNTYGDTQSVAMTQAPSRAVLIDHEARRDGVNPYNGQPLTGYQRQLSLSPPPQQQRSGNHGHKYDTSRFSYTLDPETLDTSSPSSSSAGVTTTQHPPPMNLLNGGLPESQQRQQVDGSPYAGNARVQDIGGQPRPRPLTGSSRTDSNPHVPGEFPRSSVGTTPNA